MNIWIKLNLADDLKSNDIENVRYIFIAVKNKCLDFLKLKKHLYNLSYVNRNELNLLFEMVDPHESDEDSSKIKTDIEYSISQAINNLPEKCRQIFVEKRLKGEKQKNIAQRHNISIKTIEKQMNIAYKKLRTELNYLV